MKIQVDKQYCITADNRQWFLNKTDSTGKERIIGYFTRLSHLLDELIELRLRCSKASTFSELYKELTTIKEGIEQSLDGSGHIPRIMNKSKVIEIKQIDERLTDLATDIRKMEDSLKKK